MSKDKKESVITALDKPELIQHVVQLATGIMDVIDLFEPSRPGSIAFTKIEECIMWMQVLINNIARKPDVQVKEGDVIPAKT